MSSNVLMLCQHDMDRNDLNLLKIISFLGLKSRIIFPDAFEDSVNHLYETAGDTICAVINSNALFAINESGIIKKFKDFFFPRNTFILVYNISPNSGTEQALSSLSEGMLQSVLHLPGGAQQYTVSNENIYITRQFHGLSIKPVHREYDFTFNRPTLHRDIIPLISIGQHPFFVKYRNEKCDVFFVANNCIADLDEKINDTKPLCTYFSALIPSVMFFKYVFGNRCWHTEHIIANLTIDDPLLKKRYGFLNYRTLLHVIDKYTICACIAFIPINYRRNDRDTTRLFLRRSDRFSLCVHGSQHTSGEFCTHDLNELHNKITLATRRMDEHERITGVPYDKVMIFPQGIFSCNAMKMLKYHNYCAAVNTELYPSNNKFQLKLSDCLEPAIMKYGGFPLFVRRYPERIEDFAFDAFFGKPLLIVEHHTYFRQGYKKLEDFISRIRIVDSSIRWDTLGSIVRQSYRTRVRKDGSVDIKMYANPIVIVNTSSAKRCYHIRKIETDQASIMKIKIDGGKIVFSRKNTGNILIVAEIQPQTRAEITIHYKNSYSIKDHGYRENDPVPVILRRHLSEIRDNYISKSQILTSLIYAGLRGLSRTRDFLQNNNQVNE